LAASRIREVANAGMGTPDVLAFWFGEPDVPTAPFIVQAAQAALAQGDTFYLPNLGLPELRQALGSYVSRLHPQARVGADRIALTSSGVSALMLAAQALLSPGDRVVAVDPVWPNLISIAAVMGAQVHAVSLQVDPVGGRWQLDLQQLLQALTPNTRMLIINSPGNPTGWVMQADAQREVMEHCRRHGIWVLADEAYERLVFDGRPCAPSFLDVSHPDDRLVAANTFSKTWQMTGWRLGWLVAPAELMADIEKLIEFNTSCAPGFVQRAGLAAVTEGEAVTRQFVDSVRDGASALMQALQTVPRVRAVQPEGALYVMVSVEGETDSLALAKSLVREAGLGLAPGSAFGASCEGYLRWCIARPAPVLQEGADRLARFLAGR
jgi:aspartate/methionine/tyrosine aminotransferase